MQTVDLIRAYAGAGAGLVFRLRLRSPNQALAYRLEHGRPPDLAAAGRVVPPNGKH